MVNKVIKIALGPVPSRRLGQSLGINNIPPKICTYSCIYCQLGRTSNQKIQRDAFYKPKVIYQAVEKKINEASNQGETIDYLTFVPDGEPTLDVYLGKEIKLLKSLSGSIIPLGRKYRTKTLPTGLTRSSIKLIMSSNINLLIFCLITFELTRSRVFCADLV